MRLFGKRNISPLEVDLHSHIIPNIDDGSQSVADSIEMILSLKKLGYKKIITTPHIHPRYPNTPEVIMAGYHLIQDEIRKRSIEMEVEVAAEYFVDEVFSEKLERGDRILSFGDKYVLVESSFVNKPFFFESVMFDLISQGYKPVLAHPERYEFLEGRITWLEELKDTGVLLQVTIGSIGGYYGSEPEKLGRTLLKKNMVDFLGSDMHRMRHLAFLEKGLKSREVQQAIAEGRIRNSEL
ncbi:MAG: CpsB/CapC family capsule biosynthesis tyrosine phosphatase [Ekhidna sp.]|uniref:tyrosine-protein phosphatase n=1 Tax=Ekhidna sp. TaxID=2608089 RepID=UPI0032EBC9D4